MNLMSSTLLVEDTGVPFDQLQLEQIEIFRAAWREAGWQREPRVSVSRSVIPITSDVDRELFGGRGDAEDQVGYLEGVKARFGKSYTGEPDAIAAELAQGCRGAGRRHGAADGAQPARRRLQHADARHDRRAHRAVDRLVGRVAVRVARLRGPGTKPRLTR